MSEAKLFETEPELKTKYRFIHFVRYGKEWICKNNVYEYNLGYVDYDSYWEQFAFCPCSGKNLNYDCLNETSQFIRQLNNRLQKARGEE